jgi:AhpD family alkylhydroperoxidase
MGMEENKYTQINRSMMSAIKTISVENAELAKAFQSLHHAGLKPGAIDPATKELMALACSIVTYCEGCIANHTASAVRAGASKEAFYETLGIAVLMGGGSALTYATKAVEAYQEFASA